MNQARVKVIDPKGNRYEITNWRAFIRQKIREGEPFCELYMRLNLSKWTKYHEYKGWQFKRIKD